MYLRVSARAWIETRPGFSSGPGRSRVVRVSARTWIETLQPKATEEELDKLCLEHIARFKRPKAYIYVNELPKNNYGKIVKTVLREIDGG